MGHGNKSYRLICYCIMSNHVHLVIQLLEGAPDLSQVMHSIKRYTARKANIVLNESAVFPSNENG